MVKAYVGKKVYYIFNKKDTSGKDALKQVAVMTHEREDMFTLYDAKLLGKTADGSEQYEIGTYGKFFAVTRTRR